MGFALWLSSLLTITVLNSDQISADKMVLLSHWTVDVFKISSFNPNVSVFAGVSEGGHSDEAVQESHAASDVFSGEQ